MTDSGSMIDVVVKYCGSWGYRNLYEQVRRHLLSAAGSRIRSVHGEVFPPSFHAALLSQLLSYVFLVGLVLVFAGEWIFTSVVASEAGLRVVRGMKANQLLTIGVLFGCNMVASSLLLTGAFEVYFNDQLVFSKIDTGMVPQPEYLVERIKMFE